MTEILFARKDDVDAVAAEAAQVAAETAQAAAEAAAVLTAADAVQTAADVVAAAASASAAATSETNAETAETNAETAQAAAEAARDAILVPFFTVDITATGPLTEIDIPIDFVTYREYELVLYQPLVELVATDLNDVLDINFTFLDSVNAPVSADIATGLYNAGDTGASVDGTTSDIAQLTLLGNTESVFIQELMSKLTIVDNVITGYDGTHTDTLGAALTGTVAKLRITGSFFDDSAAAFGADPDLVGGTLEVYRKPRS